MKMNLPIKPQFLCIILVTAIALVAFNSTQPPLEKIQEAAFNAWYEQTIPKMRSGNSDGASISVAVKVESTELNKPVASWTIPRHPNEYVTDQAMLVRVLELIHESDVFHMKQGTGSGISVFISVNDNGQIFETTVAMTSVQQSIQLLNLLKLLEVSDSLPATSRVSPSRL